ncbi:SpoIIE family protein phosphatase [Sediminitomix flava]|uniref:Serine phosphatase RsbU (Regulator of sigma subunit) n=1 Tax=Sediminitomix flava TaxID=379075 RepID=A0A315YZX8_SEDFL|nr:SpoIIE family protein phosphatase [Sediminitomix flava]PWJ36003.1 serine phosphatase RsbU (regulator of sigma subunit) [Sediminitomix flava]
MNIRQRLFASILTLLSFLFLNNIFAQNYSVSTYGTKTGFPSDICKSIVQDEWGFVWIATDAGIVRFDGKNINEYKKSLPSPFIKDLYVDKGQIYVSHDLGLSKVTSFPDSVFFETVIEGGQTGTDSTLIYPKRIFKDQNQNFWIAEGQSIVRKSPDGKIKRFDFGSSELTTSFEVSFSFTTDAKGNLYATSFVGSVFKWNAQKEKFDKLGKLPHYHAVYSFLHTKDNLFLVATDKGVYQFELDARSKITNYKHVVGSYISSSLKRSKNGDIYAGFFNQGVYALHPKGKTFEPELIPNTLNKSINNITELADGSIWCASSEGILQIKKSIFKTEFKNYLPGFIQTIHPYKGGIIYSQSGVSILEKVGKDQYTDKLLFFLDNEFASKILTSGDIIWAGSQFGRVYRFDSKSKKLTKYLQNSDAGFVKDMAFDHDGNVWVARTQNGGLTKISADGKLVKSYQNNFKAIPANIIVSKDGEIYVLQNSNEDYLKKYNKEKDTFESISDTVLPSDLPLQFNDIIESENGNLIFASNIGILKYDFNTTSILPLAGIPNNSEGLALLEKDGKLWITTKYGVLQRINDDELVIYGEQSGIPSNTYPRGGLIEDSKGGIWIATSKGFAYLKDVLEPSPTPKAHIINASSNGENEGSLFGKQTVEVAYNAYLKLKFISPNYPAKGILYKSRWGNEEDIENIEWSEPNNENEIVLPPLKPGKYIYQLKAKAKGGKLWSENTNLHFEVVTPWFFSPLAFISYILLLAIVIFIGIRIYTWRHHLEKQRLEKIILNRTQQLENKNYELSEKQSEILAQNEELIQLNEEVVSQRDHIEEKNTTLENQHQHITDSLRYAKKIQSAILPSNIDFKNKFDDHFILFKPKDFVSGDYYWTKSTEDATYWAVADCTGHGVPGAFMSLIGTTLLNHSVVELNIREPKDILEKVHQGILRAVSHEEDANEEGMTMGLCMIKENPDGNFTVKFAGAQSPLLYIAIDGKLERIKGNKKALGFYKAKKGELNLEQHEFIVPKGCQLYLYSDGFQDQCNSDKKRIGSTRLRSMLIELQGKPMTFQGKVLAEYLEEHQGDEIQRDDITIVGVRL